MGPMLPPWTLLSGHWSIHCPWQSVFKHPQYKRGIKLSISFHFCPHSLVPWPCSRVLQMSLLPILLSLTLLPVTTSQSYHFSQGWNPGKRAVTGLLDTPPRWPQDSVRYMLFLPLHRCSIHLPYIVEPDDFIQVTSHTYCVIPKEYICKQFVFCCG